MLRIVTAALLAVWSVIPAGAEDLPVIRAAVLKTGTVNWELSTIHRLGLDRAHGFALEVLPFADNAATQIAVAGGAADVAVADWIWVARQRAAGKPFVVIPYSRAVGSLVVAQDSAARQLSDLAGGKIAIAGGPLDKSWLILRAYAAQTEGLDLKAATEQVYGAPPLVYKTAVAGDYAGAINFWHFLAKMKAAGMRELVSVAQAAEALGLDPDVPLLGYYMSEELLRDHPDLAQALYDASRDAKDRLASDESAWQALRPQMNAASDAEFAQLRADWLAGTPARGPVDQAEAAKFLELMGRLGGADLVGAASTLPEGLFVDVR
jgi:NitT/TauT family transport system substrate-binding protein|tara:strand:+ start:57233 stop:58198 length:966 start_codon:yes stop_codon:yes gene_type:complete